MNDGMEAPNTDTIHIVDFDGTVYRGNSFHHWLIFLILNGFVTGRLRLSAKVIAALIRRRVYGGHSRLKRAVQESWRTEVPGRDDREYMTARFNSWQKRKLRPDLLNQIHECGGIVLVATAAPCDYMEGLKHILNYDALLCTCYQSGAEWVDNSRDNKRQSVKAWIEARGGVEFGRKILYTDHADDFPLLDLVDEVVLVGGIARSGVETIRKRFPRMPVRKFL
jgi:phosphoserine phosphatase